MVEEINGAWWFCDDHEVLMGPYPTRLDAQVAESTYFETLETLKGHGRDRGCYIHLMERNDDGEQ